MRAKLWPLQQPKANAERKQGASKSTAAVGLLFPHLLPAPEHSLGPMWRSPQSPVGLWFICMYEHTQTHMHTHTHTSTHALAPKLASRLTEYTPLTWRRDSKERFLKAEGKWKEPDLASAALCSSPTLAWSLPGHSTLWVLILSFLISGGYIRLVSPKPSSAEC